jgi:hypothetical protein
MNPSWSEPASLHSPKLSILDSYGNDMLTLVDCQCLEQGRRHPLPLFIQKVGSSVAGEYEAKWLLAVLWIVFGDLPSRQHVVTYSSTGLAREMAVLSILWQLGLLLNILGAPSILVKKPRPNIDLRLNRS